MKVRVVSASALAISVFAAAAVLGAPGALGSAPAGRAAPKRVQVIDNAYTPIKLTVTRGGSVAFDWSKQDYNSHTVTLINGPRGVSKKRFSSGAHAAGFHFSRTFAVAGTYHFECLIHPYMNLTVTVKR